MKLHIESIEGGTYLASTVEDKSQQLVRDNGSQPISFHCLNEIKTHFNHMSFEEVWLKQSTPYEEMVGLEVTNEKLEILIDWH
ncbi:DUF6482 family protein [Aliiglaciecola litoralis]|uniref:NADH-quinone reductase n=1 Tax=Aliiglaciecola litoralis TaxID=582857 RepID=A0ABN1LRJ0_9ALTE